MFRETVLAKEPGERYAYRVDETNAPALQALLEEWRLSPAATGAGTRVQWTFAADGPAAVPVHPAAGPGRAGPGVPGRGAQSRRAARHHLRLKARIAGEGRAQRGQMPVARKRSIVAAYGAMSRPCPASQLSE